MLTDKTERLELRGKNPILLDTWGIAELKLMRGPTRRLRNQSKKVQTVNYYSQWQILKPTGKRKANGLHSLCQNTKRDRGESYFEG
jgi:hypothetical protein